MAPGTITAYALMSLEPRGILFVKPGMEVRFSISILILKAYAKNAFHYSVSLVLQYFIIV